MKDDAAAPAPGLAAPAHSSCKHLSANPSARPPRESGAVARRARVVPPNNVRRHDHAGSASLASAGQPCGGRQARFVTRAVVAPAARGSTSPRRARRRRRAPTLRRACRPPGSGGACRRAWAPPRDGLSAPSSARGPCGWPHVSFRPRPPCRRPPGRRPRPSGCVALRTRPSPALRARA
jgi:hypothetical protein